MDQLLVDMEKAALKKYRQIRPEYSKNTKDLNSIKEFLDGYPMLIGNCDVDDFNKYISKNQELLKYLVKEGNGLFTTPVILLISYFLNKWLYTTIENWPFSHDSLTETLRGLGYSVDILYD